MPDLSVRVLVFLCVWVGFHNTLPLFMFSKCKPLPEKGLGLALRKDEEGEGVMEDGGKGRGGGRDTAGLIAVCGFCVEKVQREKQHSGVCVLAAHTWDACFSTNSFVA